VALALDRQERGLGKQSAVQEVASQFGLQCVSILTLGSLIEALAQDSAAGIGSGQLDALRAYREQYGVAD
jgi:orotate phosphoribosyltransferase